MRQLSDLLASLPLPPVDREAPPARLDDRLLVGLGAGLPAGHVHVWGGTQGAGKTALLLAMLHRAAAHGRRVLYATYDLPPETLALRLLARGAGVEADALAQGRLAPADAARAARLRHALEGAPFHVLPARGLGVASLEDRLVRMPYRAEVLAVDYLQAVVREPGSDVGLALRDLAALATRLHVAVVCALRAEPATAGAPAPLEGLPLERADRVGWVEPAQRPGQVAASVVRNRHGQRSDRPVTLDASGEVSGS
ncbi:MAG: DnaB-like helicase C-terminal domain-containing protein [Planctomycetia bacterium]